MKDFNKEININKKFILLLILVNILVIGLYYSYALFEISVIQNNVVVLKTGTIDITTTISGYNDATFTLAAGETKSLNVTLSTTNTIDVAYKMYYEILSGNSTFKVTSDGDVEGVMNKSKSMTLNFTNTGSSSITIKLGTQGGLNGYKVELNQGKEIKIQLLLDDFKAKLLSRTNSYINDSGTYYVSGAKDDNNANTTSDIDFNYVWYSGKLWRIIAINPDGTMKMITDDMITTISWGADTTYSTSWIREWLKQEFLPTLYNYQNIIDVDAGWYSTTDSNSTPIKPTGNYTLNDPVGLLNAYEYYKSYEKLGSYSNCYLNIGYYWWLITLNDSTFAYYIFTDGALRLREPNDPGLVGVRPSINLLSSIQIVSGTGTSSDPYKIKGDKEKPTPNATLLNTRMSGEYVKIEGDATGQVFRIVEKEKIGDKLTTKVVLNDYIRESGNVITKNFSSSVSLELWNEISSTDTRYWRGYLNTTWLGNLNANMLEKGTYYLGYHETGSYKKTVCSTVSSEISIQGCIDNGTVVNNRTNADYVGLLRIGELFSSQTAAGEKSSSSIWTITPFSSSGGVRLLDISGMSGTNGQNYYSYSVRPSINLKSTIIIKSGSGTKQDPFVVGYIKQDEFEYNSSNNYYLYNVEAAGRYQIELWGAQGGSGVSQGGKGAYTSGEISLNKGEKIYIYVGSQPTTSSGGYNGGGNGSGDLYRGGGGATDVRYFGTTTPSSSNLTWNSTLGLNSRIMVAAGGGASYNFNTSFTIAGGAGGGLVGISGNATKNAVATGGSQIAGGLGNNGNTTYSGSFGVGGSGATSLGTGGGGGYYGGGGTYNIGNSSESGAGGSSFISGHTGSVAITSSTDRTPKAGCSNGTTDINCSYHYSGKKFTSTKIVAGNASMPNPTGGNETGHSGNGYARITYLGK